MLSFAWHPHKAAVNLLKHGVSFAEAVTVFADTLSATIPDIEHSWREHRWITFGLSRRRRFMAVFHCDDPDADTIRIISAREGTRRERRFYEEGW